MKEDVLFRGAYPVGAHLLDGTHDAPETRELARGVVAGHGCGGEVVWLEVV